MTDAGPRRDYAGKKADKAKKTYDKKPRNSLRIGTGKKGRSAEKNNRRGSLKKRDRSKEKMMKEEAALERRTIQLPE